LLRSTCVTICHNARKGRAATGSFTVILLLESIVGFAIAQEAPSIYRRTNFKVENPLRGFFNSFRYIFRQVAGLHISCIMNRHVSKLLSFRFLRILLHCPFAACSVSGWRRRCNRIHHD